MEENLSAQQVIVDYYRARVPIFCDIEEIALQLKRKHYPRIRTLVSPSNRRRELQEFLQEIFEEAAKLATKCLPTK
jgi:hypothetical protein